MLGFGNALGELAIAEILMPVAPAAPVSTHRAQYSGIRLAKKKKQRAQALTADTPQAPAPSPPQTIVGRAVLFDRRPDRVYARGVVYIRGHAAFTAPMPPVTSLSVTGKVVDAAVIIRGAAVLRQSGMDRLSAVGVVRTDEEEALDALSNYMPWLKNVKIREDA